jgi:hypothetical protein
VQLAPVLQEVAARVNPTPPEERLRQPARWAYALRDAVALARPDWIVTHHDLQLEALAVAEQVDTVEDAPDADLAASALGAAALELTETLRGLYPSGIIAASLTGPATMAARLAARLAEPDVDLGTTALDCGDAVAGLAAAYAERGASRVIVWEPDAGGLEPGALAQAHEPLLRRLTLLGLDAVAVGAEGLRECEYTALACASGGRGAALLEADAFGDSASLDAALAGAEASAGADAVIVSDGPVPGDCDLTALRRLGERAAETKTPGGAR